MSKLIYQIRSLCAQLRPCESRSPSICHEIPPYEQLVYVVIGRTQLDGNGETIELPTSDSIILQGNVEHQATALEDTEVLDVFAPCHQGYTRISPPLGKYPKIQLG